MERTATRLTGLIRIVQSVNVGNWIGHLIVLAQGAGALSHLYDHPEDITEYITAVRFHGSAMRRSLFDQSEAQHVV
jgi:hypothetical protein